MNRPILKRLNDLFQKGVIGCHHPLRSIEHLGDGKVRCRRCGQSKVVGGSWRKP